MAIIELNIYSIVAFLKIKSAARLEINIAKLIMQLVLSSFRDTNFFAIIFAIILNNSTSAITVVIASNDKLFTYKYSGISVSIVV